MPLLEAKYKNISCKICGSSTSVLGVKDFNRSCEEEKGKEVFSPLGHAIYYHQCSNCQFIFTVDLDDWSKQDFIDNIYNNDYLKIDPDYGSKRALECVQFIQPMLGGDRTISILDYGAGTNVFSKELKKQGYNAIGWDPMWLTEPKINKAQKFDVVTAFEVLEHTPTPLETADELLSFVEPESGQVIISTLVNDIIGQAGINYWYISPRNGHVCMHSVKSLSLMFDKLGMEIMNISPSQHILSWK
jgi:hypothetical protein